MKIVRSRRGRPTKFGRPSRAVTLTLPEDVIEALAAVHNDVSRAVVSLSQPVMEDLTPRPPAELNKYGHNAVIIVKPVRSLRRMPGVSLVPLPDGRALISLDHGMSTSDFELKIRDALDGDGPLEARERSVLMSIGDILKRARQAPGIRVRQRSIIVLQSSRHRRIA